MLSRDRRFPRLAILAVPLLLAAFGCEESAPSRESAVEVPAGPDAEAATDDGLAYDATGMPLPVSFGRVWEPWQGDYEAMVERRLIRAVVPYGGYQFYYDNGKPRGTSWELLQRFEKYVNETAATGERKVYVVAVPMGRDQLIPAVLTGHADLIAGDLTVTDERRTDLVFTRPLLENVNEILVTGPGATPPVTKPEDLAGREITVRASSSYYEHLQGLAADFTARGLAPPVIVVADELLEAEDLLELVNGGIVAMTVLDDYKAEFWSKVFPDIERHTDIVINAGGRIAWAMRPESPAFAAAVDGFLRQFGKGTMIGNDTFNRYLADATRLRCSHSLQSVRKLGDLVDTFRKYGERFDFNWLMLAAQGFQESGLRQDRRSPAGAVGIMQIKPSTARDPNIAVDDITTADGNVHAGAKYMRFLADRYFPAPDFDDLSQWLFTLAAYNAGPARVARLRAEAEESGYDPDRWFDNVEIIAARRIGAETVTYVSNVFKYFVGYQLTADRTLRRVDTYKEELVGCEDPTSG